MLANLLLLSAVTLGADICKDCSPKSLCKPHIEREASAIAKLVPDLESEDPRTRQDALRDLADLSDEHENAPSRLAAEWIAKALEDERLVVRETAIEQLTDGQHPETAVKATVDLLKHYHRNMWTLVETLMGPDGERGDVNQALRLLTTSMRVSSRLRDDRIVDALASVLKAFPVEMRGQRVTQAAVESLLELGTQKAVTAVIEQFNGLRDKERAATVQRSLQDMAYHLELEGAPDVEEGWKKKWSAWFKRHRGSLPKKLGKWTGPSEDEDD